MPEVSVKDLDQKTFKIKEDRSNFDYIFSTHKLVNFEGGKFQTKRNLANRFWRENPHAEVKKIDFSDKNVQRQIIETIEQWEKNKVDMKKEYELEHELTAIKRLSQSARYHSLVVMAIFSEQTMLGFFIDEILPNGFSIDHFIKCNIAYRGIYEALMQVSAKHLEALSVTRINFEQDLNLGSLRRSKAAYRPVEFIKKYTVMRERTASPVAQ
jgi:hypothetical protein